MGRLLYGRRLCQSAGSLPDFSATASMSCGQREGDEIPARASITARACLPEPPCDCFDNDIVAGL